MKDPEDPSSGSPFDPIRIGRRPGGPPPSEGELLDACRSGDAEAARKAIADGARPEFIAVSGDLGDGGGGFERTPLMVAVMGGHVDVVRVLLQAGADPNRRMKDGGSALTAAVHEGGTAVVDVLLECGARPEYNTLVCSQPFRRGPEILLHLLARGCDVDARGPAGRTLLQRACELRDEAVVDILLAHGANPNLQDDLGAGALHHVLGHVHLAGSSASDEDIRSLRQIMRRLLAAGADVESRDKAGRSFVDLLGMNPGLVARIERAQCSPAAAPTPDGPQPTPKPVWRSSGRKSSWPH